MGNLPLSQAAPSPIQPIPEHSQGSRTLGMLPPNAGKDPKPQSRETTAIPMGFISTLPPFSFPREAERARLPNPGDFCTEDPRIHSRELEWILQPEPLFRELLPLFPAFPIYTDSFFLQVIMYSLFIIQGFSSSRDHPHTHTAPGPQPGKSHHSQLSFPSRTAGFGGKPRVFPGFCFFLVAAEALPGIRGIPEVGNSGIPGGSSGGVTAPAGAAR